MIRFVSPEWFLLLPVVLAGAIWWKAGGLRTPLRLICLVLLVLLLAGPQSRRVEPGLDLWVLTDQSASAAERLLPRLPEWEALIEREMSVDDRIFYVDFADETIMRGDDETLTFTGNKESTRTRSALEFALAKMSSDRASRILVLTDGYSTEPLGAIGRRLIEQEVPLDYRIIGDGEGIDYRIESLDLPGRAQTGEPFLLEVNVAGQPDATLPFTLFRDGQRLSGGEVEIRNGRGTIRMAGRIQLGGSHEYEVRIHPGNDSYSGNNAMKNWIQISGGPRMLLVTSYTSDPLAAVLREQGFEVDAELSPSTLSPGRLTGAKAVIFNNVSASSLPEGFMEALDFFVRAQGGGFLMAGGKQSFGTGGYHGTMVEELLPVSNELRQEHRRLTTAMAIVLDRSGSMAAGVGGGRTKMDLANEGAAQTIELLGDGDAITVFAVDSEPHTILPLTTLGADRLPLTRAVRRINSAGGGIFVYTGLEAAWKQLQKAEQGQRHVILFSDAMDSEEPGSYKTLLAEMVAEGVTVSVIGLGNESDVDAAFLKDIAARGNGRIFFNSTPSELPSIFAQETIAVARSAFITDPAPVKGSAGWLEIAASQQTWPDGIDGYNLSYLKPDATAGAYTADEHEAPLVAFWQRGIGRTAAVSFPLGGEFSQRVRGWDGYSEFLQTLTRWLAGDEMPPGLGVRSRVEGDRLLVELLYGENWEEKVSRNPPELLIARGNSGEIETATWERMEPGRYQARIPQEPGVAVLGSARVGNQAIPFGPVVLGRSPEWDFDATRVEELKHLARVSGGGERLDLSRVWKAPAERAAFRDLRLPLFIALLLLILVEAAWTRLGGRFPIRRTMANEATVTIPSRKRKIVFKKAKPESSPTIEKPVAPEQDHPPEAPAAPSATDRKDRFARAKRRGL